MRTMHLESVLQLAFKHLCLNVSFKYMFGVKLITTGKSDSAAQLVRHCDGLTRRRVVLKYQSSVIWPVVSNSLSVTTQKNSVIPTGAKR